MLLFINLNTNVMLVTPSKKSHDFLSKNSFTTEMFGEIWVADAGYL